MSSTPELSTLSTPRKLLLVSGVLLFINSFLPWYHVSFAGFSASQSGWHQLGTLVWIVLLATLVWEGARIAGAAPVKGQRADLATAAGAGLTLLLGLIFVIVRLSDGSLGIGFWIGVVLMIVFAYATFQLFQASGGQAAVREVQAEAAQRRGQAPAQTPPSQQPPAQQPPAQNPPAQNPPSQQPPAGDPPAGA